MRKAHLLRQACCRGAIFLAVSESSHALKFESLAKTHKLPVLLVCFSCTP